MRGILKHYRLEPISLMSVTTTQNAFGEPVKGYSVTESLEASVQPLTAEQASLAGLQTDRETYNVFIRPARDVSPDDRVEMRGKQWRVYASEAWQNYTLVKVEPL